MTLVSSVREYIVKKLFPEYKFIEKQNVELVNFSKPEIVMRVEKNDSLFTITEKQIGFEKLNKIKQIAEENSWEYIETQKSPPMISFKKKGMRINIYYTQMTVVTALDHPHAGKRQLVRRKVSMSLLNQIFINPRIHTGRGYYEKPNQLCN